MERKRVRFQNEFLFKWDVRQQRKQRRRLICILIGCCTVTCLTIYHILTTSQTSVRTSFQNSPVRFQMSHYWVIRDDSFFKNKEYEELMTSYLRKQSFDPEVNNVVMPPEDLDEGMYQFVEGKDDFLETPENYSDFDNASSKRTCDIPLRNVLFLKTHYTGGDIITNIFNRFADIRHLLVALPTNDLSSFYWPSKFQWRYMDMRRLEGYLPNVLCNYARYNAKVMTKFMPLSTQFVSMLRNPVDYFATVFSQLDIAKRMEIEGEKPFDKFVLNIKRFLVQTKQKRRFFDSMNLLKNGMFFDLGLHTSNYEDEIAISSAIFDLQEKFTVVLIYEYLDESLVLLKRTLCWEIDDVIYLSALLPRSKSNRDFHVSREAKEALARWNMADFKLYDFFNATLWQQIRNEEGFDADVARFRERRKEIEMHCEKIDSFDGRINFNFVNYNDSVSSETDGSQGVKLRDICAKMAMDDSEYLEYFRRE
ncbi:galactose-3-O-sulfotransferase 2-like [Dendronephthya gigantea]|uniref:galactose-3-O-sulfotransferase 2-like n=1 Tax=Dendronephthya gigantea TaxID=151771 RepID=UPI00106D8A12|nr:galactose-3-O-sulfotransferase 2-like [Dendronephthya gigantea]